MKDKHPRVASDRGWDPQCTYVPGLGIEMPAFWVWADAPTTGATRPGLLRLPDREETLPGLICVDVYVFICLLIGTRNLHEVRLAGTQV